MTETTSPQEEKTPAPAPPPLQLMVFNPHYLGLVQALNDNLRKEIGQVEFDLRKEWAQKRFQKYIEDIPHLPNGNITVMQSVFELNLLVAQLLTFTHHALAANGIAPQALRPKPLIHIPDDAMGDPHGRTQR